MTRLRRENAQLRRANEILRTASASLAAAELDRKLERNYRAAVNFAASLIWIKTEG